MTVKDLKAIMVNHSLQLSGLKKSLVERLHLFYKEDPERVDASLLAAAAGETSSTVAADNGAKAVTAAAVPVGELVSSADELENMPCQPKIVTLAADPLPRRPSEQEKKAPDSTSRQPAKAPPLTEAEKEAVRKMREKAGLRLAEIKALEGQGLKFHEEYHDIALKEPLKLPIPAGDLVVTVNLPELEMFSADLAGRHAFVHYRSLVNNNIIIKSQICKISVDGKNSTVDVLMRSKEGSIPPTSYFLRLRIERLEADTDNCFYVPLEDCFHPSATEALFNVQNPHMVATQKDIVLLPKSFHVERCEVQLKPEEMVGLDNALVIMERTSDHAMNIGMRKLILVPKVLTRVTCSGNDAEEQRATVEVRIYNASKRQLRLSKNTNIGKIFLPRQPGYFCRMAPAQVVEEKGFHAGDRLRVQAKLSTKDAKDRMPVLVVVSSNSQVDSQMTVLSGLTVVRQSASKSAYVDVTVVNPTSKYIALRPGQEIAEVYLGDMNTTSDQSSAPAPAN